MIDWAEQAMQQLDQAHDYIALSNSVDVADRVALQIVSSVQRLPAFPMSGRSGRLPGHPRAAHPEHAIHRGVCD